MASNKVVRLARSTLARALGSGELFAIGYGDVGSSIYYTLGATALYALGATPIALLIAGCVFFCTALTYAELSATFPEPGGSATFARKAFNDLISFIAGWGLLLDYLLTLSISAFTIPPYLNHVVKSFGFGSIASGEIHTLLVIGIIVFLCILNIVGIRSSGFLSLLLAIFTLLTQATIVVMGILLVLNIPFVWDHMRIGVVGVSWSPDWSGFLKGTAMAMVAYTGIESISQLAAEAKQPVKTIPRSIQWTIFTVLFLYAGLSFVGLSLLSPEELGTKYLEDSIGGIAMNFPVGGQILGPWVGISAAVILLICANAGLIGCSRLIFAMGGNYQVPRIFFKLHQKFRTPHIALIIFSGISVIIILWSRNQMLLLADLYNFGAQIAFFFAHLSLLTLRYQHPELKRPYKAPFNIPIGKGRSLPLTAIIGVFASFSVWMLVVITKPDGRIAGLVWMAVGCLIYVIYRKKKRLSVAGNVQIEEIKIPEYKHLHIKNILFIANFCKSTEALQTALQIATHHHAKISAAYIVDIPPSLPLDADLKVQEAKGTELLKRASAIGQEYHHSHMPLSLIRASSFKHALIETVRKEKYDLVVLGMDKKDLHKKFSVYADVLAKADCRVIFCRD